MVHLGATASPDVIKIKALTDTGSEVGPPLSLLASPENVALGSSEEHTRRANAGLAPHPRISLKLRLFPTGIEEGLVPAVLWFRCLVMQSGPLRTLAYRTERREEGWGIFVECQKLGISWTPATAEAKGLMKNLYILNYILVWGGDFPPSRTQKLGEAFPEDFENPFFTFSTKEKQAHFAWLQKKTSPAWPENNTGEIEDSSIIKFMKGQFLWPYFKHS